MVTYGYWKFRAWLAGSKPMTKLFVPDWKMAFMWRSKSAWGIWRQSSGISTENPLTESVTVRPEALCKGTRSTRERKNNFLSMEHPGAIDIEPDVKIIACEQIHVN